MGSSRITGACGKLMCCLAFEIEEYKKLARDLPKIGDKIKTEKGQGIVISQNVLQKKVTVELLDKSKLEVEC